MTALRVSGSRKTSVVGHFRISKDVYESLEEEARKAGVSLNTVVNQVLTVHSHDDLIWQEIANVRLSKIAFRAFLSRIPDDELAELGSLLARDTPSAMMLARKGAINLDAVLDYLHFRSRSGWFSFHESKSNGKDVLSFIHEFGARDSVLLSSYFTSLFGLIGIHPKVTSTNSSVMVEY
jgi:hypothetical protein